MRTSRRRSAAGVAALLCLAGVAGCVRLVGVAASSAEERRAHRLLDRYDAAAAEAGAGHRLVPVGDLTRQVGTWAPARVAENDKLALTTHHVEAAVELPVLPLPRQAVRQPDGTMRTADVMSASRALDRLVEPGPQDCGSCRPLQVTGATLGHGSLVTTIGVVEVPVWRFGLRGTAVVLEQVAVETSPVPTGLLPGEQQAGARSVDGARLDASGTHLTVTFIGAPGPASQACGADYTARAVESAHAVVVLVDEKPHGGNGACASVGAQRKATTTLSAPLGTRAVLEAAEGRPVPVDRVAR